MATRRRCWQAACQHCQPATKPQPAKKHNQLHTRQPPRPPPSAHPPTCHNVHTLVRKAAAHLERQRAGTGAGTNGRGHGALHAVFCKQAALAQLQLHVLRHLWQAQVQVQLLHRARVDRAHVKQGCEEGQHQEKQHGAGAAAGGAAPPPPRPRRRRLVARQVAGGHAADVSHALVQLQAPEGGKSANRRRGTGSRSTQPRVLQAFGKVPGAAARTACP